MNPVFPLTPVFGLLMLLYCTPCFGQQTLSDSLIAAFRNESAPDTARREALIYLGGSQFGVDNPDSILYYFEEAEELLAGAVTPFVRLYKPSLHGMAYVSLERYKEGLTYVQEAVDLARELSDTGQIIRNLSYSANCHLGLGNFSEAIEANLESLLLAEKTGQQNLVMSLTHNIGLVYLQYKDYEKAREYFEKSIDFFRAGGYRLNEAIALINLGRCYKGDELRKSIQYNSEAYVIAEEIGADRQASTALLNISSHYLVLGDTSVAGNYAQRGLRKAYQIDEPQVIAHASITIADVYMTHKPDSALYYARNGLELARETGNRVFQAEAAKIIYELYERKGDFEASLKMRKFWQAVNDTINDEENKRALYRSEARYEYEHQRKADQLVLDRQLRNLKIKYYLIVIVLVLGLLGILWYLRRRTLLQQPKKNPVTHSKEADFTESKKTPEQIRLDKAKLEAELQVTIGESAWNILNVIWENPNVTNREIAEKVHLSIEGVSSSLRRMYKAFDIRSEKNHNMKLALLTRAIKISMSELQ